MITPIKTVHFVALVLLVDRHGALIRPSIARLHNSKQGSNNSGRSFSKSLVRHSRASVLPSRIDIAQKPLASASSDELSEEAKSGVAISTMNLAKNILGSGSISLAAGVASFSNAPVAVIPSAIIGIIVAALSAYCFSLVGRVCHGTGADTYQDCWKKTVGIGSSWLPFVACTFKCFASALSYAIILADTFSSLAVTFGLPHFFLNRSYVISLLSATVILPLCSLKSLKPLQYTSFLGVVGSLVTTAVLGLRYFDRSYCPGGALYEKLSLANAPLPAFGTVNSIMGLNVLILISMFSTTMTAHYNAPKFWTELKGQTLPRYNLVVGSAFLISAAVVLSHMIFGFLTFGGATLGLCLNNYSTGDVFVTVARSCIGFSLLFGFPFAFIGLRDGILDALPSLGKLFNKNKDPEGSASNANGCDSGGAVAEAKPRLTLSSVAAAATNQTTTATAESEPAATAAEVYMQTNYPDAAAAGGAGKAEAEAAAAGEASTPRGRDIASAKVQAVTTVTALSLVTYLAIMLRDVGFVASFGGAALGSMVVYVFPALMHLKMVLNGHRWRKARPDSAKDSTFLDTRPVLTKTAKAEAIFNVFIIVIGACLGALGAGITVQRKFF